MNEESRLREYFASLRRTDAARSPSFEAVLGRARRRSSVRRRALGAAAAVLIAAVAVTVLQVARRHTSLPGGRDAPMLADWRAPTDFLLDTPGQTLLRTVPEFGIYRSTVLSPFPPTRTNTPAQRAGRGPS